MKYLHIVLIIIGVLFVCSRVSFAQSAYSLQTTQLYKATVLEIIEEGTDTSYGMRSPYQKVRVMIVDGDKNGTELYIDHGKGFSLDKNQLVKKGDMVVLDTIIGPDNQPRYHISDKYRLDQLTGIIVIFFAAIILLSGYQGVGSILGMIFSLLVIAKFIIPQILSGQDPLFISIIGCFIIMVATIYLAHGYSKKTTIALIATFLTLILTGVLATVFVHITGLSGTGSEDAYSLKLGLAPINLRGLLLGGILIGALGVLDDVTTGLAASLFELAKANPKYTFGKLYTAGLVIGKEHITSLVNTLVLAYAGTSLPIFLTIILNPNKYPLWSILNSEMIVEEIVRTLAGSIGLITAVPLTTLLASLYLTTRSKSHQKISQI